MPKAETASSGRASRRSRPLIEPWTPGQRGDVVLADRAGGRGHRDGAGLTVRSLDKRLTALHRGVRVRRRTAAALGWTEPVA